MRDAKGRIRPKAGCGSEPRRVRTGAKRSPQQPDPSPRVQQGAFRFREGWLGEGARPGYEHMEYTPYGELWVEHGPQGLEAVPYRFTGKELDQETGLYYYGARYLNPRTSRWISADPAIEKYLPEAPINDEVWRRNKNLPGQGGVFNTANLAIYAYTGNNPVGLVDPDGSIALAATLIGAAGGLAKGVANEIRIGSVPKILKEIQRGETTGLAATAIRLAIMTSIGAAQGAAVGAATQVTAAAVAETILSGGGGAVAGVAAVVAVAAATGAAVGALGHAGEQYVYGGSIDWNAAAREGLIIGGISALGGAAGAIGAAAGLGVKQALERIPLVPRAMKAGLAMQAANYQGVVNTAATVGIGVDVGTISRDLIKPAELPEK